MRMQFSRETLNQLAYLSQKRGVPQSEIVASAMRREYEMERAKEKLVDSVKDFNDAVTNVMNNLRENK